MCVRRGVGRGALRIDLAGLSVWVVSDPVCRPSPTVYAFSTENWNRSAEEIKPGPLFICLVGWGGRKCPCELKLRLEVGLGFGWVRDEA